MQYPTLACLTAALLVSTPSVAEVPNPEDADHITGCVDRGRLLNFEVSGWGAWKPCKPGQEWVTIPRANQNSRLFTVDTTYKTESDGLHAGGFINIVELTPVVTVGAFTVYSASRLCAIAVGHSDFGVVVFGGLPHFQDVRPYGIDLSFGGEDLASGVFRQGQPYEIFHSPYGHGGMASEVLSVKTVYGESNSTNRGCQAVVTFEYQETPAAHTIYRHDSVTNEVSVDYRRDN